MSWTQGPVGDQLRAAEKAMRDATAGIHRLAAAVDADRASRGDERATAARRGELGRDWQRIQERIDSGRTSLADVFGGKDESPEAERLRGTARAELEKGAREAEFEPDGRAGALRAEAVGLRERLEALLAQASGLARADGAVAGDGTGFTTPGDGAVDPRYLWETPPPAGDGTGTSA